jgi:hypothetical protein
MPLAAAAERHVQGLDGEMPIVYRAQGPANDVARVQVDETARSDNQQYVYSMVP